MSSMDVSRGLSFQDARRKISSTFHHILETSADSSSHVGRTDRSQLRYLSASALVVMALYIVAVAITREVMRYELIAVVLAIVALLLLNLAVVYMYRTSESVELRRSLQSILAAYDEYCSTASNNAGNAANPLGDSSANAVNGCAGTNLTSGHSQVSIVHTYRDGQWLRIPILLLAEGDIIALMGGDVAPGRCYEIERCAFDAFHVHTHSHSHHTLNLAANETRPEIRWKLGRLLQAGDKVLIRNKKYFSQQAPAPSEPTADAQRAEDGAGDLRAMASEDYRDSGDLPQDQDQDQDGDEGACVDVFSSTQKHLDYGNRHRTLAAESVEILSLSGDVRCFRMAETPVASFLRQTVLGQQEQGGDSEASAADESYASGGALAGARRQQEYAALVGSSAQAPRESQHRSRIRGLFHAIVVEGGHYALLCVFAVTAVLMVAHFIACHAVNGAVSSDATDWIEFVLVPTVTACVFLVPLSLPLMLVLAEAIATASVLASAEVTLRPAEQTVAPSSTTSSPNERAGAAKSSETGSNSPAKSRRRTQSSGDAHGPHSGGSVEEDDDDSALLENQFDDEDIDERADDIAEEVSTQVTWARYLAYLVRVIRHRLFLHWGCGPGGETTGVKEVVGSVGSDEADHYLPIPMARTRILEVLGAVTMVCFVDDDVICEGYSVTEEIFLLMDDHQSNQAGLPSKAFPQPTDMRASEDGGAGESDARAKSKQANVKGIVLDLHANPEATGSRFENPQWWRYLPSLKPLGLNAMLTYSYGAAAATQSSATPDALTGATEKLTGAAENSRSPRLKAPFTQSALTLSTVQEQSTGRGRSSTMPYPEHGQASPTRGGDGTGHQQPPQQQAQQHTERSLVRHIRHLLPQEALRELAEEIGFEQSDLTPFSRVLEVNVLAPGLENAHLLEDTHQWGQEESRRRGSLLPQLRGGVYKDYRDGSLQMMSLGDPSLVLNYCREYWDGSTRSMTPLSSGDRAEVLNVYERWRLEDFEVVAFCYSPLPTTALNPLIYSKEEQQQVVTTPGGGITRHASASVGGLHAMNSVNSGRTGGPSHGSFSGTHPRSPSAAGLSPFSASKNNTLFFVDPITTLDLQRVAAGITSKSRSAQQKLTGAGTRASRQSIHQAVSRPDPERKTGSGEGNNDEAGAHPNDAAAGEDEHAEGRQGDEGSSMKRAVTLDPTLISRGPRRLSEDASAPLGVGGGEVDTDQEPVLRTAQTLPSVSSTANQSATGRKTSRSDASYTHPEVQHSSQGSPGGPLVKSVSLDRMVHYGSAGQDFAAHLGTEHLGSSLQHSTSADGVNELQNSSVLPGSLPSPLRASASAKMLNERTIDVAAKYTLRKASEPLSPTLVFQDDDDASTAPTEVDYSPAVGLDLTPTSSERVTSSEAPVKRATSLKRADTIQPVQLRRSNSQTGLSGRTQGVGVSFDDEAVGQTSTSFSMAGRSLTPPLVPRVRMGVSKGTESLGTGAPYSPSLRKHASELTPMHPFLLPRRDLSTQNSLGAFGGAATSKQRLQQQQQRSHQQSRQLRRASTRQLWTLMRQQVFLGMAASSVPVRKDVPNVKEDLDSAGVRFVYFSAQNMKRSKPVAEKIGIPFDWNCAISLRELEGGTAQDPHRHISNYADWDVLARMPHGIEAIKAHLETVDNVPLLVSLFTDATPQSVREMVEVFRDNGEVVLTIGGGYRSHNHAIYSAADLACSVSVLPGVGSTNLLLPADEKDLVCLFPEHSATSLSRADLLLSFRLIGLTAVNFLQTPYTGKLAHSPGTHSPAVPASESSAVDGADRGLSEQLLGAGAAGTEDAEQLRLSVLMEVIRKGRILLRNMLQALAFYCVATLSLGLWPLATLAVPLSLTAAPSPGMALLFLCVHVPALCLTLLQCGEPEGVMKNTPRKNLMQRRPKDLQRFLGYLGLRCAYTLLSLVLVGWVGAASTLRSDGHTLSTSLRRFYFLNSGNQEDMAALWLVRDLMSAQALLSLIAQASTLVVRGQTSLAQFPWPWRLPEAGFYAAALALVAIHVGVLTLREQLRHSSLHSHTYQQLDWPVWVLMALLPVLGVLFGVLVNRDDERHYRRYLQFLRLEFDTRLGMHSPR